MQVTAEQVVNDLISKPGLGMFAWMCLVFFVFAGVIFLWALKSGQLDNLEDIKYEMLEENGIQEVV
jgi:cbb3-type cytochrome oxidase maturation protein